MILTLGSSGHEVKAIQHMLGVLPTGDYDEITEAAVKNFQLRCGIKPNGVVDLPLYSLMISRTNYNIIPDMKDESINPAESDNTDNDYTTDLSEVNANVPVIDEMFLPKHEYVSDQGIVKDKKYIFLHHTSGWNNPYKTIQDWASDNRGRIGTHYVIGGINIKTHDNKYDGKIVKCIPDNYFAYHLGGTATHGIDSYMHKHSIGIEICNFGWLTKKNNKFYTYSGQLIDEKYVEDLGFKFRGYQYYHKYTHNQILNLKYLIEYLSKQFNINIYNGLYDRINHMHPADAFGWYEEAVHGEIHGLLSHTNVRKDKSDVSPQLNLLQMINELNNGSH